MTDDFLSAKASTSPQPVKNAGNLLLGALLLSTFLASFNLTCFELCLQTVYKWTPPQFRCLIPRWEPRHGAVKRRSDLLCCSHSLRIEWKMKGNTGPMILEHDGVLQCTSGLFFKTSFSLVVFPSVQGDSRLSGWVSGLPQETSVDFVSCLKAFAVCGFLTCQSAILRGLGESYWLGDGPPRIHAEHTPNKKCRERESVMGTKRWHKGRLQQFTFQLLIQGTDKMPANVGYHQAKTTF